MVNEGMLGLPLFFFAMISSMLRANKVSAKLRLSKVPVTTVKKV